MVLMMETSVYVSFILNPKLLVKLLIFGLLYITTFLTTVNTQVADGKDWVTLSFKEWFGSHVKDWPSLSNASLDIVSIKVTEGCKECPRIYLPVCGNDNVTYTNECHMHCANINRTRHNSTDIVKLVRTGPCDLFQARRFMGEFWEEFEEYMKKKAEELEKALESMFKNTSNTIFINTTDGKNIIIVNGTNVIIDHVLRQHNNSD